MKSLQDANPPSPLATLFRTLICACAMVLGMQNLASAAAPPTHKDQSGRLPNAGSIAIRSGMDWMSESSPLFQIIRAEAEPLLRARGLSILPVADSTLSPLPQALGGAEASKRPQPRARKPLTLQSYGEAGSGASSTARRAARGYTPQALFYAQSQLDGSPVLFRGGRIPGRVPDEINADSQSLDYVIVCRFTAVSPGYIGRAGGFRHIARSAARTAVSRPAGEDAVFNGDPDDFVTSAGTVQGVGTLGYGSSMPAAPPRSGYGSTPGDFVRGYEGNSPTPGDPWNREADFRARDYQTRNSPPPVVAAPPDGISVTPPPMSPAPRPSLPKPPLPGDTDMPAVSPGPAINRAQELPAASGKTISGGASRAQINRPAIAGYALEMECYDLKPVREGKRPRQVWRCAVQQRADKPSLSNALPAMVRAALGGKK